jgi:hypothetical protein
MDNDWDGIRTRNLELYKEWFARVMQPKIDADPSLAARLPDFDALSCSDCENANSCSYAFDSSNVDGACLALD